MLQLVPGIRIAAPRDEARLREEFAEAIAVDDAPTVVRFPKGAVSPDLPALERLADGTDVLWRTPRMCCSSASARWRSSRSRSPSACAQGIGATVIDPRWVVPVQPSVVELAAAHRLVITIEDGIRVGGVGTRVRQVLREAGVDTAVDELGLPDEFIDHATREQILDRRRAHGREDRAGRRRAGARHPHSGRPSHERHRRDLGRPVAGQRAAGALRHRPAVTAWRSDHREPHP
jgi:1-deoxy-D-xylulose-5-phosphate synthase